MNAKGSVQDLALHGGSPLFAEARHVGAPNTGDRAALHARLDDMLDRRWLTNRGPFVAEFEARIADFAGVKHCVATCNGTAALEIVSRALDVHGEVVVPSATFVATPHAFRWQEIQPRFADVTDGRVTLDSQAAAAMVTPHTGAVVGVHLWGQVCDVEELGDVARASGIPLIFDAAHALGCSSNGKRVGGFGDAEILSFHATKFLNTFEGGAILTDRDDVAERARLLKNFGFTGEDQVEHLGINGKMSEISAAMGLTQLDGLSALLERSRERFERYAAGVRQVPGLSLLEPLEGQTSNHQYIVVLVDQAASGLSRDDWLGTLKAEGVLARRYFYPGCHRMQPYLREQPQAHLVLPNTEALLEKVLVLPAGDAMSDADIDAVCGLLSFIAEVAPLLPAAGDN